MDNTVFRGKRNKVWLEGGLVRKLILPGADRDDPASAALKEGEALRLLRAEGVAVPRLTSVEGALLTMEYVAGITLTDEIERAERGQSSFSPGTLAGLIADWFVRFYAALPDGVRRGDVNCRNFILTEEGRLFSVDFESLPQGRKEEDLGRLAAYILTYDPPYTEYKLKLVDELTNRFAELFDVDRAFALDAQAEEIKNINQRRCKKTPYISHSHG